MLVFMLPGSYEEGRAIELTSRQKEILKLVQQHAPVTGDQIAEMLGISKPTIRTDFSVLVMLELLDAKPKVGYFPGPALLPQGQSMKQLQQMQVKDVHGVPVIIRETSTVHDAVVTLFLENVGTLIITDEDSILLGIVSRKDLLKVTLGNPNASSMPIGLVMTRQPNLVTVSPDDFVVEAARRMIHHQVDSLPVVIPHQDADGQTRMEVVGRITKTNMTRLLLDLMKQ